MDIVKGKPKTRKILKGFTVHAFSHFTPRSIMKSETQTLFKSLHKSNLHRYIMLSPKSNLPLDHTLHSITENHNFANTIQSSSCWSMKHVNQEILEDIKGLWKERFKRFKLPPFQFFFIQYFEYSFGITKTSF